jgi:hypothetical protein
VHVVVYILAGAFLVLAAGLAFTYFRQKHIGLLLMSIAYGASAGAALSLMEWWPLVAGFVIAWLLRLVGLDPEVPRRPRR